MRCGRARDRVRWEGPVLGTRPEDGTPGAAAGAEGAAGELPWSRTQGACSVRPPRVRPAVGSAPSGPRRSGAGAGLEPVHLEPLKTHVKP